MLYIALFNFKSIESGSANYPISDTLYEILRAESQPARQDPQVLQERLKSLRDFTNTISLQLWDLFRLREFVCQLIANTEDAIRRLENDDGLQFA